MSHNKVQRNISINAEPSKVWYALTHPDQTKKYFFNAEVISDWQPGSTITFKGKMLFFFPYEMEGRILAVMPEKMLKYTLKNGKDDTDAGSSTVTDMLIYEEGHTTVYVTDDVGDGEGAEERIKKSEAGWEKVLKGLKEVVEAEDAPITDVTDT